MQALECITPHLLIFSFFVLLYLVAIIYSIAYGRDVESLASPANQSAPDDATQITLGVVALFKPNAAAKVTPDAAA